MGNEKPLHEVTISQPFKIGKHEVTFLQYDYYVWDQRHKKDSPVVYPSDATWGRFDRPVININWDEATAYTRWLSDKTGMPCRLPTEAEWEYAARSGTETAYWWGNEVGNNHANCADCGSRWDDRMTAPVGSFLANPWNLYDTAGNVWEWCQDASHYNYHGAPTDGSAWEPEGSVARVVRGGSWFHLPINAHSAARYYFVPSFHHDYLGFRALCSAPIE